MPRTGNSLPYGFFVTLCSSLFGLAGFYSFVHSSEILTFGCQSGFAFWRSGTQI